MAEDEKRFQIPLNSDEQAWLAGRAERVLLGQSVPIRARRELALWRAHLAAELRATTWTLEEIGCLANILGGTFPDDTIGYRVELEVSDAFEGVPGSYGEHHEIDEARLLEKVAALSMTGNQALMDAIARWWADEERDHSIEGWTAVGVRVAPTSETTTKNIHVAATATDINTRYVGIDGASPTTTG